MLLTLVESVPHNLKPEFFLLYLYLHGFLNFVDDIGENNIMAEMEQGNFYE